MWWPSKELKQTCPLEGHVRQPQNSMLRTLVTREPAWQNGPSALVSPKMKTFEEPESHQKWYGMERLLADALDEAGIAYIGENYGHSARREVAPKRCNYKFDFFIPGDIPTFIEVKHSWLGNAQISEALPLAALEVFAKCRLVLIIIGAYEARWKTFDQRLWSKVTFFEPTVSLEHDARQEAIPFTKRLLAELPNSRIVTREETEGKSFSAQQSSINKLFGSDLESAIDAVSAYFIGLIEEAKMDSVKLEMAQLKMEYASGHFTACALRLGRTLELATYAFASAMGEPTESMEHQAISSVQGSIRELSQDMNELNYASSDPDSSEYGRARSRLVKSISTTQTALLNLVAAVDTLASNALVPSGRANVDFLLRRAQKSMHRKHAPKQATEEMARIINDGITRKILSLRNEAAHGDPELKIREVTKNQIDQALIYLTSYISRLGNVAS